MSIEAYSKVPGCQHALDVIRANLHPDRGGLCRMLDATFREHLVLHEVR
jgi:hypothetical protein